MPHTDKQFPKSDADLKDESFARNEKKVFPYTDKQPQTVIQWIKHSDIPIPDDYNGEVRLYDGYTYKYADYNKLYTSNLNNWEWCNRYENVLLYTPEELEALLQKERREAAERAIQKGVNIAIQNCELKDLPGKMCPMPSFETDKIVSESMEYLNQHYPLPQPINTNQ